MERLIKYRDGTASEIVSLNGRFGESKWSKVPSLGFTVDSKVISELMQRKVKLATEGNNMSLEILSAVCSPSGHHCRPVYVIYYWQPAGHHHHHWSVYSNSVLIHPPKRIWLPTCRESLYIATSWTSPVRLKLRYRALVERLWSLGWVWIGDFVQCTDMTKFRNHLLKMVK